MGDVGKIAEVLTIVTDWPRKDIKRLRRKLKEHLKQDKVQRKLRAIEKLEAEGGEVFHGTFREYLAKTVGLYPYNTIGDGDPFHDPYVLKINQEENEHMGESATRSFTQSTLDEHWVDWGCDCGMDFCESYEATLVCDEDDHRRGYAEASDVKRDWVLPKEPIKEVEEEDEEWTEEDQQEMESTLKEWHGAGIIQPILPDDTKFEVEFEYDEDCRGEGFTRATVSSVTIDLGDIGGEDLHYPNPRMNRILEQLKLKPEYDFPKGSGALVGPFSLKKLACRGVATIRFTMKQARAFFKGSLQSGN